MKNLCYYLLSAIRYLLLILIRLYQLTLSALLGRHCRFHPTCSHYAADAIRTHGATRGSLMAFFRIARCGPSLTALFRRNSAEKPAIEFDPVPAVWQDALPKKLKLLILKIKGHRS